jgi:hypothetical protein
VKDFILYRQPIQETHFDNRPYDLSELQKFPGSSRLHELEVVTSGSLRSVAELETHRIFEFSCQYYGPKPRVSPAPPLNPAKFELWQRPMGPLVVSFDPPRKVSRVAVALLSLAIFGDPFLILPLKLYPSDFLELRKRVRESDGSLSQLVLHKVSTADVQLRRVQLIGRQLENLSNLDAILNGAADIACMGFVLPSLGEGGRKLSFRILEWGGGQIYSPAEPLPHEIYDLLDLFEKTLGIRDSRAMNKS